MGEAARKVAANHDWDKVAARMAAIYRILITMKKNT
jgi:hypothetical protein